MDSRVLRSEGIGARLHSFQVQRRAGVEWAKIEKSLRSIRGGHTPYLSSAYLSMIVSTAQLPSHLQFAANVLMVLQNL